MKALVLDSVHNIEIVRGLQGEKIQNVASWSWQKQLRFYLRESKRERERERERISLFLLCIFTDLCEVFMVDAQFNYTYEYQGNAPKLVHTPLTDKCYLTLTQAMLMGLGGNPYGPAGTGKTESVKALGGLMGRQVLVFNCDEVENKCTQRKNTNNI